MIPEVDPSLLPRTRIHPINLLPQHPAHLWLKREDEAGYAVAGGKLRKFASLLPYLQREQFDAVLLVGGASANHTVAALQLLRASGIEPITFTRALPRSNAGNHLLFRLLTAGKDVRTFADETARQSAIHEVQSTLEAAGKRTFLLPEGAFVPESLPGAGSLADDIQRNERAHHLQFNHIFIDSGTGLSAAALILGLQNAGHPAQVHVVEMAHTDARHTLRPVLDQCQQWRRAAGLNVPELDAERYRSYPPVTARAFGSVNRTVFNAIHRYAREFGVLTDPIYSAKLFLTAEKIISETDLRGNILLIHSGGAQTLPGFAARLFPE
ncbi:MAG: pyridoxal-phosphate dependent enzyme [Bacteroidota bacterium]